MSEQNIVFVLSTAGWVSHGPRRASEQQAHNVARLLNRRLGWVTAVGSRAPSAPHPLPSDLPSRELAGLSPVWRDPGLAARWYAATPRPMRNETPRLVPPPVPKRELVEPIGPTPAPRASDSCSTSQSVTRLLKTYYETAGIAALTFRCQHHVACRGSSTNFVSAQEGYVGPDYGTRLPRLVFMSLDSGSLEARAERRTMEAVRARVLADDVNAMPRGRHWRETHELALELLRQFDSTMSLERVNRFFAHVNAAKCCQNKPGHAKADAVLFRNCREHGGAELRLLRPQILVTQGDDAHELVRNQLRLLGSVGTADACCRIVETDSQTRALWIATYHPRNYGHYWPQKAKDWQVWARAALEFVEHNRGPD